MDHEIRRDHIKVRDHVMLKYTLTGMIG